MFWRWLLLVTLKFRIFWQWRFVPSLVATLSRRSNTQAVFVWPDQDVVFGPRVAYVVHFDGANNVRPYVADYLRALQRRDFRWCSSPMPGGSTPPRSSRSSRSAKPSWCGATSATTSRRCARG